MANPKPEPTTTLKVVNLPESIARTIKSRAAAEGQTIAAYLTDLFAQKGIPKK